MSRFHENSIKWFNEQIKKCKTKTSNVEDLKQCIYCPKIFKSSAFVMKHIFKRHTEQFLRHHKKFMDTTNNELGLDPETVLINYLKSEFSNIKSELKIVKEAVAHHTQVGDNTKSQVICSTGCQECSGSDANAHENIPSLNMPKHFVENIPKEDFEKLQEKVEEMSQKYKEIVSSNKEIPYLLEDRICRRLKKELIKDYENLLIQNRDSEWKPHLSQLKNDLNKMEQLVEQNAKKIAVRSKMDEQIQSFFENYGTVEERSRTSSKCSRKGSNDSSLNMNAHRVNRRAKSIYTSRLQVPNLALTHLETSVKTCDPQLNDTQTNISGSQGSTSSWRQCDASIKTKYPQLQSNVSEPSNVQPLSILKEDSYSIQKIGTHKAKALFVEKLKAFGISLKTKQLSAEEFEIKNHLVDSEKKFLCRKYKNFEELYASLDSHANELVKAHMDRKSRKQLRFSDSNNFQASVSKDEIIPDHEQEKSSPPVEKVTSPFMNQSEFMLGACGDFNNDEVCEKPHSTARNMAKGNSSESEDKVVLGNEKKKALSPVEKVTSPFTEFKQDLGTCVDNIEENSEKPNSNCEAKTNSKSQDKVVLEHEKKTFLLVAKVTSPFVDQSESLEDLGARGDCNIKEDFEKPNWKLARDMKKGHFASGVTSEKTEKFEYVAALPQNVASNTSFSVPPCKVVYPGPSNDHLQPIEEFSELSSLESDTDLFPNEFDRI